MLTKMVLENFYSFKERTEIDFKKTSYTICPENVSESKVLKGAVFVGANGSGKTNVIKGIKYLLQWLFKIQKKLICLEKRLAYSERIKNIV